MWFLKEKFELRHWDTKNVFPVVSILSGLTCLGVYRDSPFSTTILGFFLLVVGCASFLIWHWRKVSLGSKFVWIPLLVIVLSALGSYRVYEDFRWVLNLAWMGFYSYMFLLFLVGRAHAGKFLYILAPIGAAVAVSCIVEGIVTLGGAASGIFSNSNVAASFMGISVLFCRKRWKWLIPVILLGIYSTRAYGAVLGLICILVVFLVTRDWNKISLYGRKFLVVSFSALLVIVVVLTFMGVTQNLYQTSRIVSFLRGEISADQFTKTRVERAKQVISEISPTGYGLPPAILPTTGEEPVGRIAVHNAPLLVLDELGPLAAVSWLFVMGYLIVKSRFRYVFIFILAVSMVSNFTWWPYILGPLTWYLWGSASGRLK